MAIKTRILRGQLAANEYRKLIIDDGNFNQGFRVTRFVCAGDPAGSSQEIAVRLSTEVPNSAWNWGDSREIAWASTRQTVEATWGGWEGAIDTTAVVLQEMWIDSKSSAVGTVNINYLIELEPVTLTDNEAVLVLIKENSQDV